MKPIRKNAYDVIANLLCLALLFSVTVFLLVNWSSFPDQVPGHYNAHGEIDRWANKGELLLLPIIAWLMYLMITLLERFPQLWNTGVTITEENREPAYRVLKNMILTNKIYVVGVFTYLFWNSIKARDLPAWFLPITILIFVAILVFFSLRLRRARG